MNKNKSRIVYSTENGRLCKGCGRPVNDCTCKEKTRSLPGGGDGVIRISRESKGRKGKGVSLIKGLLLSEIELKVLAKKLKQFCGSGGAVKGGIIEIQGDHRDKLFEELAKQGYQVKKAGG